MPNHARALRYGVQQNAIARQQDFCYICNYLKIKFKALNTLINSAEYTIKQEKVFLILCLKILLGHINRGELNVYALVMHSEMASKS